MALRKVQKEMAIVLFAKAFSTTHDDNDRKELFIQFSDAYEGSIKDWKDKVEEELGEGEALEAFKRLSNKEPVKDLKEFVTIEPLTMDDIEQISFLASRELDLAPWIIARDDNDSYIDFVNSGYSYVAKQEDVILGFVLAYKCPTYGGYYYLYIDTIVVDGDAQGKGIGTMLIKKIRENMFHNRIFRVKLMTQKGMPAYKIYKHLGFEDIENYVHMQRY